MSVQVTNNLSYRVYFSYPLDTHLDGREEKDFEYVSYDSVISEPNMVNLINSGVITVLNLDAPSGAYDSEWNAVRKFRLGDYHLWVTSGSAGELRMKYGDAASDLDGYLVVGLHGATHVLNAVDAIPDIEILEGLWTSGSSLTMLDVVYDSASNTVAKADASGIATMPVIGIIIAKPTSITALVATSGEITGFVGLTPDTVYFASLTPGVLTATPPTVPTQVVQKVGYAKNTTTLIVEIEPYTILS